MVKKDDYEPWRIRFPSAGVSWSMTGDSTYCQQFMGEAKVMLYNLKNRMRLSGMADPAYTLKSLQDIQRYNDGTLITVRSTYGMDFVEIIAGRGFASCSITLFDLPTDIQPHRYPGIIGEGKVYTGVDPWELYTGHYVPLEVEGTDYIKTYYNITRGDCDKCSEDKWSLCEAGKISVGIGKTPSCLPFIYDETDLPDSMRPFIFETESLQHIPHRAIPVTVPPQDPAGYINNHCIHSLSTCQAEIISFGSDDQGSYFLWKAYTEWSLAAGPSIIVFSRSGLGYMDLRASIDGPNGAELCNGEGVIKVDCCKKAEVSRLLTLWWESLASNEFGGPTCSGQSYMFYGNMKICEVPAEVYGLYVLLCVSWMGYHSKTFWVFPEIRGSCLPFTWTVSNQDFTIVPSIPDGESAQLKPVGDCLDVDDPALCTQEVTVTVKDRCGVEDKVTFLSCCTQLSRGEIAVLSINYDSLAMGCSGTQDLTALGGCGPYSWSYTGAGSLSDTTGTTVTYTAPPTNPECENNDTVTVTDCCGNQATITLYVSCNPAGNAYRYCDSLICTPCYWGGGASCYAKYTFGRWRYACNGTLIDSTFWDGITRPAFECYDGSFTGCCTAVPTCADDPTCSVAGVCSGLCTTPNQLCGTYLDTRTAAMKTNGCCPINPDTGLPF